MQSQENKQTPIESMEYVFAEPHDADMYIAYALRALVHETKEMNIYLNSIDNHLREVGVAAIVYRNIT